MFLPIFSFSICHEQPKLSQFRELRFICFTDNQCKPLITHCCIEKSDNEMLQKHTSASLRMPLHKASHPPAALRPHDEDATEACGQVVTCSFSTAAPGLSLNNSSTGSPIGRSPSGSSTVQAGGPLTPTLPFSFASLAPCRAPSLPVHLPAWPSSHHLLYNIFWQGCPGLLWRVPVGAHGRQPFYLLLSQLEPTAGGTGQPWAPHLTTQWSRFFSFLLFYSAASLPLSPLPVPIILHNNFQM